MAAENDALLKRVQPHSIEAEQSVIGAMLMDRDAIIAASEIVTEDDFYQRQYGVMFQCMVELFNEGQAVDVINLQNRLKEKDVPPEVASLETLRDIITTVPTSANVRAYAEIVREKSMLRKLIRVNEEIANTCYAGKEKLEDILAHTEKAVFDLLQSRTGGDFVPIRQVALNVLEKIEIASKTKDTVTGIPTGFIDLDYKTSGMQPSDFILIAARPSMGKTAFVLNLVDYVAVKKKRPCMIFSLEMSKEQLAAAKELAEKMEGMSVTLTMKAGEGGKAFGSVSGKEIAAAAKEQLNLEIDKKKLVLPEAIKTFGNHEVPVKLHKDVTGKLTVKVVEA